MRLIKGGGGFAVLDADGKKVGLAFVDIAAKGSKVATIGPVTSCSPGAGKMVFEAACKHAEGLGFTTLLLQQVAANTRSFSLYTKCGFQAKHTCHYMGGFLADKDYVLVEGLNISEMKESDVDDCAELFTAAYGKDCGWNRGPSILGALHAGSLFPKLVARRSDGRLVGYSTGFVLFGHQVTESEDVFRALFAESSQLHLEKNLPTPRFHCPIEHPNIVAWALSAKLTLLRATVIMVRGTYDHLWPRSGHVVTCSIAGW